MIGDLDVFLRLAASLALGGIVGYERQARHKSAGLRTHILVSMGSCLIMILSINIYMSVQGLTNADPSRLAAQVVSGIGFLGAGTIMKEGVTVKGLTTAASLWVVSGIGLAVGSGYFVSALFTTGLAFLTLSIVSRLEQQVNPLLLISTADIPGQICKISSVIESEGVSHYDIRVEEHQEQLLLLSVLLRSKKGIEEIMAGIARIEGVNSVKRD